MSHRLDVHPYGPRPECNHRSLVRSNPPYSKPSAPSARSEAVTHLSLRRTKLPASQKTAPSQQGQSGSSELKAWRRRPRLGRDPPHRSGGRALLQPASKLPSEHLAVGELERRFGDTDGHRSYDTSVIAAHRARRDTSGSRRTPGSLRPNHGAVPWRVDVRAPRRSSQSEGSTFSSHVGGTTRPPEHPKRLRRPYPQPWHVPGGGARLR